MNYYEFITKLVFYYFDHGDSFDPWDLQMAWRDYQADPNRFSFLSDEGQ